MDLKTDLEEFIAKVTKANTFGPKTKNFSKVDYVMADNHMMVTIADIKKILRKYDNN